MPTSRAERAREVARAHAGALGERRHRQVGRRGCRRSRPAASRSGSRSAIWRGELRAELRLAAGPLQEEHEPARDLERRRGAEVLLDQREAQVHARRSRRRRCRRRRPSRRSRPARRRSAGWRRCERRRTPPSGSSRGGRRAARPGRAGTRRCRPRRPGASARAAFSIQATSARPRERVRARPHRRRRRACRSGRGRRRASGPAGGAGRWRSRSRASRARPPRSSTRRSARRDAIENTSAGPTRSRAWSRSKATRTTLRVLATAVIATIIAAQGDGSKDNYRTISARASVRRSLPQAPLDPVEHRLAVRVALLVVAELPQLRRRQAVELLLHLRGGQLVVAGDRQVRRGAVAVPGLARRLERSRRLPSIRSRSARKSSVARAPRDTQALRHLLRVRARHAPPPDGVVEELVDRLARHQHDVERAEHARDEPVAGGRDPSGEPRPAVRAFRLVRAALALSSPEDPLRRPLLPVGMQASCTARSSAKGGDRRRPPPRARGRRAAGGVRPARARATRAPCGPGAQRRGGSTTSRPRAQQVVDRIVGGRPPRARNRARAPRRSGRRRGRRLKSPPKISGRSPANRSARSAARRTSASACARLPAVAWRFRHAQLGVHRPR